MILANDQRNLKARINQESKKKTRRKNVLGGERKWNWLPTKSRMRDC
jgi:uncharacterized protein involved in outer membrane biogenesis